MPKTTAVAVNGLMRLPLAAIESGAELYQKRARALGEYWTRIADASQPADLMQVQADYWTHLLEDYAGALTRGAETAVRPAEQASREAGSGA